MFIQEEIEDAVKEALPFALKGHVYSAMMVIEHRLSIKAAERELRGWRTTFRLAFADKKYTSHEAMLVDYAQTILKHFGRRPCDCVAA